MGTARVDITPPPGPSTWGHGPDALATQGYWTRLQCRVFVIEANGGKGPHGEPVRERYAIVPCDLPAISYSLFREVAHRVEGVVAGDHILLTATHTHAGPGHYFESGVYSGFLSARRAGFDTDMLAMLSARIGRGILEAAKRTVPATLRWGDTHVVGMTRNRSPQAFALNGSGLTNSPASSVTCPLAAPLPPLSDDDLAQLRTGACADIGAACKEVDPRLSTLTVREAGSERPLGSITFFAMHPTVLPAHTRLFGGDVFAVASRELERVMRVNWASWAADHAQSPDSDPLAAIVNTNEGDIVPVWSAGDVAEAQAVGARLAVAALRAHIELPVTTVATVPPVTTIATALVEADMARAAGFLKVDPARPAELGQGSSHGGSDHATSIDDIVARLPDWAASTGGQDPKTPVLGVLDKPLAGPTGFPALMPFSLWHIGDRWIAGVPAELTVTTGFHVRNAIVRATGAKLNNVIIAGLANSYMQYVASCEEFQLQHYEGSSTLYGSGTESFIARVESSLGCALSGVVTGACPALMPPGIQPVPFQAFDVRPDADRTHERYPQPRGARSPKEIGVCQLPQLDPFADAPRICVRWFDASPGDIPLAAATFSPGPWLSIHIKGQAAPFRWAANDPRSFLDDLGDDFQVRARADCGDSGFGYSAVINLKQAEWDAMNVVPVVPGKPRFSLVAADSSVPLVVDFDRSTTPRCTRNETLYCLDQYDPAAAPIPAACGE